MRLAVPAFAVVLGLLVLAMPVRGQSAAPFTGFGDQLPPAQSAGGTMPPGPAGLDMAQRGVWQPQAYAGPFGGFGDTLPPADPIPGMSGALPGGDMGGVDMSALMNMLGGLQGAQGAGMDPNALLSMLGGLQGLQGGTMDAGGLQALLGGLGGQGGMDQLLQLLGSMYGVDMSQGLDPALIQQGLRNLREMQTWEGMEGMDFSPLTNLLGGLEE